MKIDVNCGLVRLSTVEADSEEGGKIRIDGNNKYWWNLERRH